MRVVTVERGVDPRDLALVAFGGAGPLHACAVADALGMRDGDRARPGRRALGGRPARRAASSGDLVRSRGRRPARARPTDGAPGAALAARPARFVAGGGDVESWQSTAATRARATSCALRRAERLPRRARAAQRLRPARARRSRWSRCGPGRAAGAAAAIDRPARRSTRLAGASARRSSPSPTARSGSRPAGRPSRVRAGALGPHRRDVSVDPADAADPRSRG